jgi:hypothetical protein
MSTEWFEPSGGMRTPNATAENISPYTSYSGWAEDVRADVSDTENERVYVEPQQLAQLLGWFSPRIAYSRESRS